MDDGENRGRLSCPVHPRHHSRLPDPYFSHCHAGGHLVSHPHLNHCTVSLQEDMWSLIQREMGRDYPQVRGGGGQGGKQGFCAGGGKWVETSTLRCEVCVGGVRSSR